MDKLYHKEEQLAKSLRLPVLLRYESHLDKANCLALREVPVVKWGKRKGGCHVLSSITLSDFTREPG